MKIEVAGEMPKELIDFMNKVFTLARSMKIEELDVLSGFMAADVCFFHSYGVEKESFLEYCSSTWDDLETYKKQRKETPDET